MLMLAGELKVAIIDDLVGDEDLDVMVNEFLQTRIPNAQIIDFKYSTNRVHDTCMIIYKPSSTDLDKIVHDVSVAKGAREREIDMDEDQTPFDEEPPNPPTPAQQEQYISTATVEPHFVYTRAFIQEDVQFVEKKNGHFHIKGDNGKLKYQFWATTETWMGTDNQRNEGIYHLIEAIRDDRAAGTW